MFKTSFIIRVATRSQIADRLEAAGSALDTVFVSGVQEMFNKEEIDELEAARATIKKYASRLPEVRELLEKKQLKIKLHVGER